MLSYMLFLVVKKHVSIPTIYMPVTNFFFSLPFVKLLLTASLA